MHGRDEVDYDINVERPVAGHCREVFEVECLGGPEVKCELASFRPQVYYVDRCTQMLRELNSLMSEPADTVYKDRVALGDLGYIVHGVECGYQRVPRDSRDLGG